MSLLINLVIVHILYLNFYFFYCRTDWPARPARRERSSRSTRIPRIAWNERCTRTSRATRSSWITRIARTCWCSWFARSSRTRGSSGWTRRTRTTMRSCAWLPYWYLAGKTQSDWQSAHLWCWTYPTLGRIQYVIYGWQWKIALTRFRQVPRMKIKLPKVFVVRFFLNLNNIFIIRP